MLKLVNFRAEIRFFTLNDYWCIKLYKRREVRLIDFQFESKAVSVLKNIVSKVAEYLKLGYDRFYIKF